jgi:hypothetical protein
VLAHTPHCGDAAVLERGGDFPRRGLQRLRLLAQPDGIDYIAGDTFSQPAGNGFNFGKFGHASLVYKGIVEACATMLWGYRR